MNTYRILEAHNSRPDLEYTLVEALEVIAPYRVGVILKQSAGLLHLEGSAFYLQPITHAAPDLEA